MRSRAKLSSSVQRSGQRPVILINAETQSAEPPNLLDAFLQKGLCVQNEN